MTLFEISSGLFLFVPIGFFVGCIPLAAGLGIQTIINAMKRF
ncbi:hypothetical protein AALB64_07250 [Lachnospiraceae bacterium 45-P1]